MHQAEAVAPCYWWGQTFHNHSQGLHWTNRRWACEGRGNRVWRPIFCGIVATTVAEVHHLPAAVLLFTITILLACLPAHYSVTVALIVAACPPASNCVGVYVGCVVGIGCVQVNWVSFYLHILPQHNMSPCHNTVTSPCHNTTMPAYVTYCTSCIDLQVCLTYRIYAQPRPALQTCTLAETFFNC